MALFAQVERPPALRVLVHHGLEPSTGLHPKDLDGLLTVLDRLVGHGATIVIVEHNTDFIRAAAWVVDLGPGAGPQGGRALYQGPPAGLLNAPNSLWHSSVSLIPRSRSNTSALTMLTSASSACSSRPAQKAAVSSFVSFWATSPR